MDMRELRFGVEIETTKRTRQTVAEAVCTVVGGTVRHVGHPACYDPWEVTDARGRIWKVVADSSLTSIVRGDEGQDAMASWGRQEDSGWPPRLPRRGTAGRPPRRAHSGSTEVAFGEGGEGMSDLWKCPAARAGRGPDLRPQFRAGPGSLAPREVRAASSHRTPQKTLSTGPQPYGGSLECGGSTRMA